MTNNVTKPKCLLFDIQAPECQGRSAKLKRDEDKDTNDNEG